MAPASNPTPTIAQRLVSGWMWLLMALIVLIWPVWMALVYLVTARRDPRHPYVAVSNHESLADIFLMSYLPWEMKWLSKEAIFRIPLIGWMMRMAGDIPVLRGERRSRAAALEACRDRLGKKVSVISLPEGTRSTDKGMLPFHDGAFRLAVDSGLPVLPMAVEPER